MNTLSCRSESLSVIAEKHTLTAKKEAVFHQPVKQSDRSMLKDLAEVVAKWRRTLLSIG